MSSTRARIHHLALDAAVVALEVGEKGVGDVRSTSCSGGAGLKTRPYITKH
jgi:hypothetical protein